MRLAALFLTVIMVCLPSSAADVLYSQTMATHVVSLGAVPNSATDIYTQDVWLVSIELIPQSTTSPTCTVQDKAGTPNIAYNALALTAHTSFRDTRPDTAALFMKGGITWSCSDTSVKGQLVVKY